MQTINRIRGGASLPILVFLAAAAGCHGWQQPPTRDGLAKPWPGYFPIPCRTAPCAQPAPFCQPTPCCQPVPHAFPCCPPCQPMEICEPICVRPETGETDTRTGQRGVDSNEPSRSTSR